MPRKFKHYLIDGVTKIFRLNIKQLKSLFERNQTLTEKRHNFHRRTQEPGESVDSFAVALREFGAKCGFKGEEYKNRLVDQFILGMKDRPTQKKTIARAARHLRRCNIDSSKI